MFLILRNNEPVGIYDKIQDLVKDVENRMIIDWSAFERSALFNKEDFELEPYLDVRIVVCKKNEMNWVSIDFTLDEIDLTDFLNEENSQVIQKINHYNENFLIVA